MEQHEIRKSRPLTEGELLILREIQNLYGPQNASEEVFLSDDDEAAIVVKDREGQSVICAVLTNLAAWLDDGTIPSRECLRREWLVPSDAPSPSYTFERLRGAAD